jgi:hypothetical protein
MVVPAACHIGLPNSAHTGRGHSEYVPPLHTPATHQVSEGNQDQWNYAAQLAGDGGWVLLTFAGVDRTTTGPQQSWVQAVAAVQVRTPMPKRVLTMQSDARTHNNNTCFTCACRVDLFTLPPRPRVFLSSTEARPEASGAGQPAVGPVALPVGVGRQRAPRLHHPGCRFPRGGDRPAAGGRTEPVHSGR